jgi:hypothetical protein
MTLPLGVAYVALMTVHVLEGYCWLIERRIAAVPARGKRRREARRAAGRS